MKEEYRKMNEESVKVRGFPEENYILVTIKGPLTFEIVNTTFQKIIEVENFSDNMGRIWDLTEADMSDLHHEIVKDLTAIPVSHLKKLTNAKIALVSNRDINIATMKLYKFYSRDMDGIVEVFNSIQDAKKWLAEP